MTAPAFTGTPGLENPRMRSETAAICEEWIAEMQAHRDDRGRFQILPSEAAKVVAEKHGLSVEAVLAIVGTTKPGGAPA